MSCNYEGKDYGAGYIDAQCIDGYLYDLDNCDENGNLYEDDSNIPCPKCNTWDFTEYQNFYGIKRVLWFIKIKYFSYILNINTSREKMS